MNEHIVPMFRITRAEVLDLANKRIESLVKNRALLEEQAALARLDRDREAIKVAKEVINVAEERAVFLRDHLDAADSWVVTAAQATEMYTALEPMDVDWERLRLSADPGKILQQLVYNQTSRTPRW